MSAFFTIRDLETRLGSFHLGPLALQMKQQDYLVLLGPTASGKSSLLQTIAGIYPLTSGKLFMAGEDITSLPSQKRHIGLVIQGNDLFPHLDVKGNVAYGLHHLPLTASEKQRRLDRYLDLFRLLAIAQRPVAALSGGEQRRVAMARCLITQPRLLLLDEPLSMLDHNARQEMLDVLKLIHTELHTTTLHVTHDRLEAWSVAQTCAVMNAGQILQVGSVAEVFRQPNSRLVAEFLGGINILPITIVKRIIKVPWGTLSCQQSLPFKQGYMLLRPEHISLQLRSGRYQIIGRVTKQRDFGQFYEVEVALAKGSRLVVHTPATRWSAVSIGAKVFLNWAETDLHFFPEV